MSKKTSVFYPKYQLRALDNDFCAKNIAVFQGPGGVKFSTEFPMFGITETQKVALRWLGWHHASPVIAVGHDKPTAPDTEGFYDPDELHRYYWPYAMAVVTAECLGEDKPRKLKVYFCDIELHESAKPGIPGTHAKSKGTYVVRMG